MPLSREIHLAAYPVGMPDASNFTLAETSIPDAPEEGGVVVRNVWMSVDPYMRGRMNDVKSYVPPFQVGAPLDGGAVGQVMASRNASFPEGGYVLHGSGWREWFASDGKDLRAIDPADGPLEANLGVLGMPGLTAYAGLTRVGAVKAGERVFVSAASGAVGSVVCQLAKARGCYVVGSAGSDDKCAWLEKEARVDKAINYKTCGNLNRAVRGAFPEGIDVYFENVGGAHLQAALYVMNTFGRIALCGMIDQYNNTAPEPGPSNLVVAVRSSLKIEGFIVFNHRDLEPAFRREMAELIGSGRMKWRQSVEEGIERAPEAFLGLFTGTNFGKMLVRLGPDEA